MRNFTNKTAALLFAALLAASISMNSCGAAASQNETTDATTATKIFDIVTVPEPIPPETTSAPETTEPAETTAAPIEVPEFLNPLTGLEAQKDLSLQRPTAIMINNIRVATPQEGVSYADIMYECVVEGLQTRLMMVVSDYESLPVVGSVRSSREYYLDFAANHNALYVHAGGSTQAYVEIKSRKVDNLDGVNMYLPNMFYRDAWRRANMGYEHSLMTDGARIAEGIRFCKYNTALKDGFDSPLDFVPYGEVRVPEGGNAAFLQVTYSNVHMPNFKYNAEEGVYYREQFLGVPHMDNTADKQLSFTNILVLYCPTKSVGDSYNHMDVITTGKGEGYYLTAGGYEEISWSKASEDVPVKLFSANGEPLLVNRGKTFFQICTTAMKESTVIQ